jgi:hypothetical protein
MKFLEMKDCPHCGTRVLPTTDNLCPNCRLSLIDAPVVRVEIDGETSPQDKQQVSEEISVGDLPKEKQQGLKHDAKCPNCGLINPAGTITCDCGYNFVKPEKKPKMNLGGWGTLAYFFNPIMIIGLIFAGPPGWFLIWLHSVACNKMRSKASQMVQQAEALANDGKIDEALLYLEAIENNFRPEWLPKQWASLYISLSKKSGSTVATTKLPETGYEKVIQRLLEKINTDLSPFFGRYHQYETFSDGRFIELADELPCSLQSLRTRPEAKPLRTEMIEGYINKQYRSGAIVSETIERSDGKVALVAGSKTVIVDKVYFDYLTFRYPRASVHVMDPMKPVSFLDHGELRAILMPIKD